MACPWLRCQLLVSRVAPSAAFWQRDFCSEGAVEQWGELTAGCCQGCSLTARLLGGTCAAVDLGEVSTCQLMLAPRAGVMQRTVRSQAFAPDAAQSLCFHPLPESQPVLPCLLRRLLQKGRQDDALELARCDCLQTLFLGERGCGRTTSWGERGCGGSSHLCTGWISDSCFPCLRAGGTRAGPTSTVPWSGCCSLPWSWMLSSSRPLPAQQQQTGHASTPPTRSRSTACRQGALCQEASPRLAGPPRRQLARRRSAGRARCWWRRRASSRSSRRQAGTQVWM